MLWQKKKKRKKATKSKAVTQTAPHQPTEELPRCGAGATLIAGIHAARKQLEKANLNHQNHLLVVAQDIDETVALMCYIQLSLLGVAGYVKVGNSLTEPMTDNDDKENYWFTPMYFSNVWVLRRIFGGR